MNPTIRSLTLVLFLASVLQALAANYYVTQGGSGNRDGSSAANAWALAAFNAGARLSAGDTVYFSGTLTGEVTVSGKSYLTLSGGSSSMSSGTAIRLNKCNNLIVDNWTFTGSDINGWPIFAYSSYCTGLTYSNCTVTNCGYAFLGANDKTVLITGCDVLSSQNGTTNIGNQTDLIHGGGWQNVVIEKSRFVLRAPGSLKSGSDGSYRHNDVIQTFATRGTKGQAPSNWTIRYCWIECDVTAPPSDGSNSWLMIESQGGYFKVYSNVFVCPTYAGGINNGCHFGTGQAGTVHIFYNNTVVKKAFAPNNAISFNDAYKPAGTGNGTLFCVNNIAYCPLTGFYQGSTGSNFKAGQISNNFWFNFGKSPSRVPAIPAGPGGFRNVDPLFTNFANDDFSLTVSSPCRGAGNNSLGSEYNQGIAPGASWPNPALVIRAGAWDVGAYVAR